MYSAALQRYYNEHEHLPYTFYAQPKRFTQYAIEKRGELLATAYNYIEPDAKGTRDFVEYSSADFTVTDFHSAGLPFSLINSPSFWKDTALA